MEKKQRETDGAAAENGVPDALVELPRRPWPLTESRDWCGEWSRGAAV